MTESEIVPEDVIQHLHMIQAVIGRLSNASFRTKQLALIVSPALLALIAQIDWVTSPALSSARWFAVAIPFAVTAAFLLFDARFVYLEHCYRAKYDVVRGLETTDFDMSYDDIPGSRFNLKFCRSHYWEYGGIYLLLSFGTKVLIHPFGG